MRSRVEVFAKPRTNPMQNDSRANHADAMDKRRKGPEQFPVDVKVLLGISIENETFTVLRIAVMSSLMTVKYSPYREYHAFNERVSINDVNGFVLRTEILDPTESAINAFLANMSAPHDIPQVVDFQRGVYNATALRKRLYQAVDPDDTTRSIGCLIEQDERGGLVQVTWYKTTNTQSVFQTIPKSLSFTVVKNESGESSLDPNDIGGWTWYHSTGKGIGLSAPPT
jgi:hypothetical protein